MKNLDKILEQPELVKNSEVKRIFRENDYEKEAVENWLYVNEAKLTSEMENFVFNVDKNSLSDEEYNNLIKVLRNKHENIRRVFHAYTDNFNLNVCFKDFFDSYMNPVHMVKLLNKFMVNN